MRINDLKGKVSARLYHCLRRGIGDDLYYLKIDILRKHNNLVGFYDRDYEKWLDERISEFSEQLTIDDISECYTKKEMLETWRQFGKVSLKELEELLNNHGLELKEE